MQKKPLRQLNSDIARFQNVPPVDFTGPAKVSQHNHIRHITTKRFLRRVS